MREYNYTQTDVGLTLTGIINEITTEIKLLMQYYPSKIYQEALNKLMKFHSKYPNINTVCYKILDDLLLPENVDYCFEHGHYPRNASELGLRFENDVKEIFKIEEELTKLAAQSWQKELTPFDEIENGKDFMVVGHSALRLPGVKNNSNYKEGKLAKTYVSCSLFSNSVFDTFFDNKVVFLVDVTEENYIAASSFDSATGETTKRDLLTIKEINDHIISVGYHEHSEKGVTSIALPKVIEVQTMQQSIKKNGEILNSDKSPTINEVVLDRTKTNTYGALLLGNGCDLLLGKYQFLKQNNIPFKCLNKGLYREKNNLEQYTQKEYQEFINQITNIEVQLKKWPLEWIEGYYKEVVLPMQYKQEILDIIDKVFAQYIDISTIKENEIQNFHM